MNVSGAKKTGLEIGYFTCISIGGLFGAMLKWHSSKSYL